MLDWSELASGFNDANAIDITEFIQTQRWYGGKGRGVAGIELVDQIVLREEPRLIVALVEVRGGTGTSDVYQLVLGWYGTDTESGAGPPVTVVDKTTIYEASQDPKIAELMSSSTEELTLLGHSGEVRFRTIRDMTRAPYNVRSLGTEQSNTSVVVNEQLFLKLYRRLEAGTNPELEMLLFLTEHDFSNVPKLAGWASYGGSTLRTTLGLAQEFMANSVNGWSLGIDELSHPPEHFTERLSRLGEVVGEMHCGLASDFDDPAFAPEQPTEEATALLGAKLETQIDELSDSIPDGRSDELRGLARLLTESPISGELIRTHGDLHLGQLLWTGNEWYVIDFEGEPARSLAERRQKLHPLRDVAGLLRSFSYLAAALELDHNIAVPPDWEQEASEKFLAAYRTQVSSTGLLPSNLEVQERILRIFELEKILYELDYEIQHRPSWISVPLAGIDRLLAKQLE